jgi:hypothetical protein
MPGVHGGTALAATVFGENNPGGKLPATVCAVPHNGPLQTFISCLHTNKEAPMSSSILNRIPLADVPLELRKRDRLFVHGHGEQVSEPTTSDALHCLRRAFYLVSNSNRATKHSRGFLGVLFATGRTSTTRALHSTRLDLGYRTLILISNGRTHHRRVTSSHRRRPHVPHTTSR